jgi:CheY-like chemotaxis protein
MSVISGKHILLVEDEAIVALMVEEMLTDLGATVVGPAGTIARGLTLAEREIDAAVLDVNVRDQRIDPIAERLRARRIPMVFATGYGRGAIETAGTAPIIDKPYTREKLAAALSRALSPEI